MKIYDYDFFKKHLEIEIEKSKRYGFCFTVILFENQEKEKNGIFRTHIGTGFRMSDVVAEIEEGKMIVLMHATRAESAEKPIERFEKIKGFSQSLRVSVTEMKDGDNIHLLLARLNEYFPPNYSQI